MDRTHTVVVGLGVTGLSCVQHLYGRDRLTVIDSRSQPPCAEKARSTYPDVQYVFGVNVWDYTGVDRVIVSPGMALDSCLLTGARTRGVAIESDMDLFYRNVREPVYAVTGTNGKSTVTALAAHLLQQCGYRVAAGGNLGEPALNLLAADAPDCYVMELSSFQLERLAVGVNEAAVILNISEDHIDRHGSIETYAAAKQQIFSGAKRTIANRDDSQTNPQTGAQAGSVNHVTFGFDKPSAGHWGIVEHLHESWICYGDQPIAPCRSMTLPGQHNLSNALAALALVGAQELPSDKIQQGLASFSGLPHRCVKVAEHKGVTYINDSKATNVGAAIAALEGLGADQTSGAKIVLIAGGEGKGADFSPLLEPVAQHCRSVITLGEDGPLIASTLASLTSPTFTLAATSSLALAIAEAEKVAQPGDLVLLAPACASFDMFANYAARGDAFAAAVAELVNGGGAAI